MLTIFSIPRAAVHFFFVLLERIAPYGVFFSSFFSLACVSFVVVYLPSRGVEKELCCLNYFMPQHSTAIKPSMWQLAVRYEMIVLFFLSHTVFSLSCLCASMMPWPAGLISFFGCFF